MTPQKKARILGRLDRTLSTAGIVALVAILVVIVFGTTKDRAQDSDVRDIACANVTFSGKLVDYFGGSKQRLLQRQGTDEELSTDRAALSQLEILLSAAGGLSDDLNGACGRNAVPQPLRPKPKEKENQ